MTRHFVDDDDDDAGVKFPEAQIITETPAAVRVALVHRGRACKWWIPKSNIHDDSEVFDAQHSYGLLVVKAWFARREGYE